MTHTINRVDSHLSTTIENLFCGNADENRKIVIPDMQREYCWPSNGLVEGFVESLFVMANNCQHIELKSEGRQMGLLYGYEMPKGHLQLCDGQQRITTIYLLIGVLFHHLKKMEDNSEIISKAKNILISDYEEKQDDKEPRLQYAIRESTLMFLRDLVNEYFLMSENEAFIKSADWYFSEYENDPTVQNMILCVETLIKSISCKTIEDNHNLLQYLIQELRFLYFDMKDRAHGEEQFVVINTTGKALTSTENSKPKFLGKLSQNNGLQKDYSDRWEAWEQFFWEQRINKNDTHFVVDENLKEFFRWVFIIELSKKETESSDEQLSPIQNALSEEGSFDLQKLSTKEDEQQKEIEILDSVQSYFIALKSIVNNKLYVGIEAIIGKKEVKLTQKECMQFLPVLLFVRNQLSSESQPIPREVVRLQRFYWSRSEQFTDYMRLVSASIKSVQMMDSAKFTDIALMSTMPNVDERLFTTGEKLKFELYNLHNDDSLRDSYEESIWAIENLECCKGHISFVFDVLREIGEESLSSITIANLQKICKLVDRTINIKDTNSQKSNEHNNNCLFRRALLTKVDYQEYSGWTSSLGMHRYAYAENARYFLDLFRSKKEETLNIRNAIISMLKEASLYQNLSDYYEALIEKYLNEHPNDNTIRYALISQPEIFKVSLKGRITCDNTDHPIYSMYRDSAKSGYTKFSFDETNNTWFIN